MLLNLLTTPLKNFEEVVTDIDFVLDCVDVDEVILNALKILNESGILVSIPTIEFSSSYNNCRFNFIVQ